MTYELQQRELVIDLDSGDFEVRRVKNDRVIGPVDYGWERYNQAVQLEGRRDPHILTWGGGPLAGSRIPGSRRLVFTGYSHQWEGFYISSFGGGAYVMHRVGVDFFTIKGQAPQDSVLILNHKQGEISVRLEPIDADVLWTGYADPHGERLIGFYALQQAVFDRYKDEYDGDWVRVFTVGPAARLTKEGVIGSNHVKRGEITAIDDWAGRGGLGSTMLQQLRVAACIFGGDWEDLDLKDSKEIDGYFLENYGKSMIQTDLGVTEKYRYVPGFRTGGTFGSNMYTVDDKLFSYNYNSIYESDEDRLEQHDEFILDHYLKQFNEEIIEPKNFAHCGEPCSVACKKYVGIYKKDYEPYQALGPLCGVFDQRAAEELNHFVDAMGLDAIQTGGVVAWVMELVRAGIIDPAEYGLPPSGAMVFEFESDDDDFDLVADSKRNSEYAMQVVSMMLFEAVGEPFRQGIRYAAKQLDSKLGLTETGKRTIDRAVFTSHGEHGCMVPNQYWVPGMFGPMPMMGKYFTYYGVDFLGPRALGRKSIERMVYEFFSENSGVCRFHRKWAEAIVDDIISAHYNLPINYEAHQFGLVKAIYELEGDAVVFWESERTVDVVWQYLEKWVRYGLRDTELLEWVEAFRADKWSAARAYWDAYREGMQVVIDEGPDAIPQVVAPYKAARMDVMDKGD